MIRRDWYGAFRGSWCDAREGRSLSASEGQAESGQALRQGPVAEPEIHDEKQLEPAGPQPRRTLERPRRRRPLPELSVCLNSGWGKACALGWVHVMKTPAPLGILLLQALGHHVMDPLR